MHACRRRGKRQGTGFGVRGDDCTKRIRVTARWDEIVPARVVPTDQPDRPRAWSENGTRRLPHGSERTRPETVAVAIGGRQERCKAFRRMLSIFLPKPRRNSAPHFTQRRGRRERCGHVQSLPAPGKCWKDGVRTRGIKCSFTVDGFASCCLSAWEQVYRHGLLGPFGTPAAGRGRLHSSDRNTFSIIQPTSVTDHTAHDYIARYGARWVRRLHHQ